MNAAFYTQHLHLQPHPEGGYFRETYRAAGAIAADALPSRFTEAHNFSTAIYYLLEGSDCSVFHRIKSDECWHFYAGNALLIHVIEKGGRYFCIRLGTNIAAGETFQFVVPATAWFAAEPAPGSSFVLAVVRLLPALITMILKLRTDKLYLLLTLSILILLTDCQGRQIPFNRKPFLKVLCRQICSLQ